MGGRPSQRGMQRRDRPLGLPRHQQQARLAGAEVGIVRRPGESDLQHRGGLHVALHVAQRGREIAFRAGITGREPQGAHEAPQRLRLLAIAGKDLAQAVVELRHVRPERDGAADMLVGFAPHPSLKEHEAQQVRCIRLVRRPRQNGPVPGFGRGEIAGAVPRHGVAEHAPEVRRMARAGPASRFAHRLPAPDAPLRRNVRL